RRFRVGAASALLSDVQSPINPLCRGSKTPITNEIRTHWSLDKDARECLYHLVICEPMLALCLSSHSAHRNHQLTSNPCTSSPLRPGLGFRYTQGRKA